MIGMIFCPVLESAKRKNCLSRSTSNHLSCSISPLRAPAKSQQFDDRDCLQVLAFLCCLFQRDTQPDNFLLAKEAHALAIRKTFDAATGVDLHDLTSDSIGEDGSEQSNGPACRAFAAVHDGPASPLCPLVQFGAAVGNVLHDPHDIAARDRQDCARLASQYRSNRPRLGLLSGRC